MRINTTKNGQLGYYRVTVSGVQQLLGVLWPCQDVGALQQIRWYKTVSSACNSPPQNCYDAATPWNNRSGATSPSTTFPADSTVHQFSNLQGGSGRACTTMVARPRVHAGATGHVCGRCSLFPDQNSQGCVPPRRCQSSDHKRPLARCAGQAVGPRVEFQQWLSRQVHFLLSVPFFRRKTY